MDNHQNSLKEIEELMKELADTENELSHRKAELGRWRKMDFQLTNGNWSLATALENLKVENESLSDKVKKITEELEDNASKHESVERDKEESIEETWSNFMKISSHYRNLIISAKEEYTKPNLLADIKKSNKMLQDMNKKNEQIVQDMENLTSKFGLAELGTNVTAKRLNEIEQFDNSLKEDQLSMKTIITAYEDKLRIITCKIETKEREIENLSNKKYK